MNMSLSLSDALEVFSGGWHRPASPTGVSSKARWLQASQVHNPAVRSAWLLPQRRRRRCYDIAHSRPHQASSAARLLFNASVRPLRYKKKSPWVRRPQGCNGFWKCTWVNVRLLKDGTGLCFQIVCRSGESGWAIWTQKCITIMSGICCDNDK